jgi:hypothetical protein
LMASEKSKNSNFAQEIRNNWENENEMQQKFEIINQKFKPLMFTKLELKIPLCFEKVVIWASNQLVHIIYEEKSFKIWDSSNKNQT